MNFDSEYIVFNFEKIELYMKLESKLVSQMDEPNLNKFTEI